MASPSPTEPWWRRWFGDRSERAAAHFLKNKGFRILLKNYRCDFGEIDLIALDGPSLVFVEVRSTESLDRQRTALSVDRAKQRRLTRLATHFLQSRRLLDHPARFDVVIVSWPQNAKTPTIDHYPLAFDAVDEI